MLNHFRASVGKFDEEIRTMMNHQCLDASSPCYGAVEDLAKGYTEPGDAVKQASYFITAYYHPLSVWYHDPEILKRALLGINHTLGRQYENGTLDLMETNFRDPTYTAFCVHEAGPALKLIQQKTTHTPLEDEVCTNLETFVRKSGDSMVEGGFHTPNHRWVVSSALSYCYNTIHDEKYLNHIYRFLNEGIDCDQNGEFTERSAGTYNIVCDRAFIWLAEELGMKELLDHVTRNLSMVMTYIEPDETINTLNSTRQDFGRGYVYTLYYDTYLKMALLTGNSEFAWFADRMFNQGASCCPVFFLLHPEYEQMMLDVEPKKPVLEYEKLYEESGIVRQRIGDATMTLIKERPLFAKLQIKDKAMLVRFDGSFFGSKGQFVADSLEKAGEDGYRLTYHTRWGYTRPLAEKPASPFWKDMDHSKREHVGMQDYEISFLFKLTDGKLTVDLDACTDPKCCTNIPIKLELMFTAGGIFENDASIVRTKPGSYIMQKASPCSITYADHTKFRIQGGFCKHYYAESMRGSLPVDQNAFTLCFTGYTPEKQTITIEYEA